MLLQWGYLSCLFPVIFLVVEIAFTFTPRPSLMVAPEIARA
jgi:hypothetical protein